MPVPGANRLGQGIPGGLAGLPGSLPLPGGGTVGPPAGNIPRPVGLKAPVAGVAPRQAALPVGPSWASAGKQAMGKSPFDPSFGPADVYERQNTKTTETSTKTIIAALGVLDQVRAGKLKPNKAAQLMQGLTPGDQMRVANLLSSVSARTKKKISPDELKTLQMLQSLPAPADPKAHDLLTNLANDVNDLITGLPTGIGLTAAYAAKDTANILLPGHKPTSNLYDKILTPIGKTYAKTYGPALHGDFGKTLHQLHEHPLQPILDVATVATAGIGGSARLGAAGKAVAEARAARTVALPRDIIGGMNEKHIPMKVDMSHQKAVTKLWDHLDNNPNFDVDHFESLLNRLGEHAHPEYNLEYQGAKQVKDPHQFLSQLGGIAEYAKSLAQSPADLKQIENLVDKAYHSIDTKVPVDVMRATAGPARSMTGDFLDQMQKTKGFDEGQVQPGHPSYDPLSEVGRQDPHQLLKPYEQGSKGGAKGVTLYHGSEHLGELDPAQGVEGGLYLTDHPGVAKLYAGQVEGIGGVGPGKIHETFIPDEVLKTKVFDGDTPITPFLFSHSHNILAKWREGLGQDLQAKGLLTAQEKSQTQVLLNSINDLANRLSRGEVSTISDLRHAFAEVNSHDLVSQHLGQGVYGEFMKGLSGQLKSQGYIGAKFGAWPGDIQEASSAHGLGLGEAAPTHEYLIWDKSLLQGTKGGLPNEAQPVGKLGLAAIGAKAFARAGGRGGLIDFYDRKKGITHEAEIQDIMKEIQSVFDNDNLRIDRRKFKEVVRDVAKDIRATREAGKARPGELEAGLPGFISAKSTGRALSTAETALLEASDLVRAGAIYLRPAYLPNNWAGNTFMNTVHQGAFAPINLAKSLVVNKYMDPENVMAMRKSMGANPAEAVVEGSGRGYVSSLTQPIAHVMGALADQPFRDAAFLHEARRAGYRKLKDVDALFNKARNGDEAALRDIAEMSRRAQEEIVKFGRMNEQERSVIRNLVFVYSWMRGAGRYAGRFPLQHPIQTAAFNQTSQEGNRFTESIMGGVPSFMTGIVPIGRDKNGNPRVINPFSLNPLGTGLQIAKAAMGTMQVIRNPKEFNKYAQQDIVGLLNPLIGAYIEARSGGQPVKKQLERTIALMALYKGWTKPGTGSIYPTSRAEAVGHFTIGSLFPRIADEAAIKKALARQNIGNPAAMIPQEMKDFKKATGNEIPGALISAYKGDLVALQLQKDFQHNYAVDHGSSGFRNMPPQNRFTAGIEFLKKYSHIPKDEIASLESAGKSLTTDEAYNEYANAVWNMMGVGQYRDAWLEMMRSIRNKDLTRKR